MNKTFIPLLILSIIACCIEIEISVPGFPDMATYFGVSAGTIQLTIALNFLGFCLASLCNGPFSEYYGRRKVMLAGNAVLLAGAAGCVFAPTIDLLLFSRFLQGLGASTSAVVVFAMISDVYQGDKASKLIGIMNSVLSTLIALAPIAGGFINGMIGWKGNYALVALICLTSWILLYLFLPETKTHLETFNGKRVLKDYKKLFSNTFFIFSSTVPSLLYAGYLAFVACGSFLYMTTFDLSIDAYVTHQGIIVAAFSIVSFFSGRIVSKIGSRMCAIAGIAISVVGSAALVITGFLFPLSPFLTTAFMIVYSVGFAICYPVIFSSSLEIFPEIKGTASSAVMSMRALLISGLIGFTSYVYNGQALTIAIILMGIAFSGAILIGYLLKKGLFAERESIQV